MEVDKKEDGSQYPGYGVAEHYGLDAGVHRDDDKDPEDSEDTYAAAGHKHGDEDIPHGSESAGIDFDEHKGRIGRHNKPQDLHSDLNDGIVGGEKIEHILSQRYHNERDGDSGSEEHP